MVGEACWELGGQTHLFDNFLYSVLLLYSSRYIIGIVLWLRCICVLLRVPVKERVREGERSRVTIKYIPFINTTGIFLAMLQTI